VVAAGSVVVVVWDTVTGSGSVVVVVDVPTTVEVVKATVVEVSVISVVAGV
jgi:hypothetical protein